MAYHAELPSDAAIAAARRRAGGAELRAAAYPEPLQRAMIERHLRFFPL